MECILNRVISQTKLYARLAVRLGLPRANKVFGLGTGSLVVSRMYFNRISDAWLKDKKIQGRYIGRDYNTGVIGPDLGRPANCRIVPGPRGIFAQYKSHCRNRRGNKEEDEQAEMPFYHWVTPETPKM
jgi:hypothetical protein